METKAEKAARFADLYNNQKWTYARIGEQEGISRERVRQILKSIGQDAAIHSQTDEEKEEFYMARLVRRVCQTMPLAEIIAAYNGGASLETLSKRLKITSNSLSKMLIAVGVKLRTWTEAMALNGGPTISEETLRDLWVKEGYTQEGIAKMLGVSPTTISKAARRHGLYRKSYSDYR